MTDAAAVVIGKPVEEEQERQEEQQEAYAQATAALEAQPTIAQDYGSQIKEYQALIEETRGALDVKRKHYLETIEHRIGEIEERIEETFTAAKTCGFSNATFAKRKIGDLELKTTVMLYKIGEQPGVNVTIDCGESGLVRRIEATSQPGEATTIALYGGKTDAEKLAGTAESVANYAGLGALVSTVLTAATIGYVGGNTTATMMLGACCGAAVGVVVGAVMSACVYSGVQYAIVGLGGYKKKLKNPTFDHTYTLRDLTGCKPDESAKVISVVQMIPAILAEAIANMYKSEKRTLEGKLTTFPQEAPRKEERA